MAGKREVVGDVARDYCLRYPSLPSRQIARLLCKEEPALFLTVERARNLVRRYRGAAGAKHRAEVGHTGGLVERLALPEPEAPEFTIYELPRDVSRWLILADLHIPYYDAEATGRVMEWAMRRENRCDGVMLLGDVLDFYQISRFQRDPRNRDILSEMDDVGLLLDSIKKNLKPKRIIWKEGNHELRLEDWRNRQAPELLRRQKPGEEVKPEYLSIEAYLKLAERGVTWIPWMTAIRHRALNIYHEIVGAGVGTVNPARTAFLKTMECSLVAHSHRASEHAERTARGVNITCWSVPALCEMHPRYARENKWGQGCATLDTRGDKWRVTIHQLIEGVLL